MVPINVTKKRLFKYLGAAWLQQELFVCTVAAIAVAKIVNKPQVLDFEGLQKLEIKDMPKYNVP